MPLQATTETRSVEPSDVDSWLIEPEAERSADELQELASSLAGGQEEAIIVRETEEGIEGVNGYWRLQAVRQYGEDYGIEALEAEIRDMADYEAARSRLVSDVFHAPDTYMDQARLVSMIHQEFDSQADTAEYIGKSRTWVSKKLSRLSDPEPVQEAGETGQISEDTAAEMSEEYQDNPEAVEDALDYASQNPEATQEEVSEALNASKAADRDTSEVRELVEQSITQSSNVQHLQEQAETREALKAEKQELQARKDRIHTELPEAQAAEYEQVENARSTAEAAENAVSVVEETAAALEDSAEATMPTEAQESKLTDIKADLRDLQGEFGQPTYKAAFGDSDAVHVQPTSGYDPEHPENRHDGRELWTIRVVVDPDDPPEAAVAMREALEDYGELAREAREIAGSIREAESLNRQAEELRQEVGRVENVDTFDIDELSPDVAAVLAEHSGKTLSELEKVAEGARETVEEADVEALEEAHEEHTELMEELEEVNSQLDDISDRMPPQNVGSNLSQRQDELEEARDEATQAFESLPDDERDRLTDIFADAYGDDVSWLIPDAGKEICGVETADGDPCQNPAGSCPHHSADEQEAAA